jgi:hypothetical protein
MKLRFDCPTCRTVVRCLLHQDDARLTCPACRWSRRVDPGDIPDGKPRCCLVCGNLDLWRQKDFPQALGLGFVVAGAGLSTVAWSVHRPVWALGILMLFAAADFLLFAVMPDVLVCYRCRARHSASGDLSRHAAFNHELGERYRQEQLRLGGSEQRRSVGS